MNESSKEEILTELRRITKLLALMVTKDQIQRDKIALLSASGFQSKEIADLLGTTPNLVRAVLSDIRKKAKGGKGKTAKRSKEAK